MYNVYVKFVSTTSQVFPHSFFTAVAEKATREKATREGPGKRL
jgi:hypothetical protein